MSALTASDVIAISSVAIAVCALATSIWQGIIARRHSILSVRPHLEIIMRHSLTEKIEITLKNGGLGPALITSIDFRHSDEEFEWATVDISRFILRKFEDYPGIQWRTGVPDKSTVLSPSESVQIFALWHEHFQADLKYASQAVFAQALLIVNYQCIYGKKYVTTRNPLTAQSAA